MADFDLTRPEASATVTAKLDSIAYVKPLGAWPHESGAWLVVGYVPGFDDCYTVHWRCAEIWYAPVLQYIDAYQDPDKDRAWRRALASAKTAWEKGPMPNVIAKAIAMRDGLADRLRKGGETGGKNSGKKRAANAEARKAAEELAKKFRLPWVPQYDPSKWTFAPVWDASNNPVVNFNWNKQQATCAFIGPELDGGGGFYLARGWYPGMNDDNARIEETIAHNLGLAYLKDDAGVLMLERLLKTDPEKWLKGDYTHFA